MRCNLKALLVAFAFLTVSGRSASDVDVKFRSLNIPGLQPGYVGAPYPPKIAKGERVFDTAKGWNQFRSELGAARLPRIDFSKKRVIGTFLGPGSATRTVRIDRITYSDVKKETQINYSIESMPPGGPVPATVAYPLAIVEVERHPGTVVFAHREVKSLIKQ